MVGPTWTRVRFVLGSDCLPTLFQRIVLPRLASSSNSMLPSLCARACPMSDDLGVVLVRFTCLVIMRVDVRLHGTLYPMMDCVLYLDRLVC